jgi:hypothetical protein
MSTELTTAALVAAGDLERLTNEIRPLLLRDEHSAEIAQALGAALDAVNGARTLLDQAVQRLGQALRSGLKIERALTPMCPIVEPVTAVPTFRGKSDPLIPAPLATPHSLTPPWTTCRKYKGPRSKCGGNVVTLRCEQCDWTVTLCARHCKRPGMVVRAHVMRVHEGRSVVNNLAKWKAQQAGANAPATADDTPLDPSTPPPPPTRFRCKVQNGDEQPCGARVSLDEFTTHLLREHGKECQPRQARLYFTDEPATPD